MPSKSGTIATVALLLGTAVALAAPAPWHVWRSRIDGVEHCAQTSPGPGWAHVRGPYRDLRCSVPVRRRGTEPASPRPSVDPDQRWLSSPGERRPGD